MRTGSILQLPASATATADGATMLPTGDTHAHVRTDADTPTNPARPHRRPRQELRRRPSRHHKL